jgi:hypothetical protein
MLSVSDVGNYRLDAVPGSVPPTCLRSEMPDDRYVPAEHFDRLTPDSRPRRSFRYKEALAPGTPISHWTKLRHLRGSQCAALSHATRF